MNRKKTFFFLFLLLLANAFIFVNKDKCVYKKQISYATLYSVVTDITVKEMVSINDSVLECQLKNTFRKPVKWNIAINDTKVDSFTAESPQIKLVKGINTYTVYSPRYTDTLFARIEFVPAHRNNRMENAASITVYRSNFGNTSFEDIESDKDIFEGIDDKQQKEIQQLLTDSIGIFNNMSAALKVEKICIFLHKKIGASVGTPNESTLKLNAFDQYKTATAGAKIWCGIYARIFNLFVASTGIKCRAVEIFSNYKNVNGSVHVCNEYFLPELKQWVAADIMFNNIRYLNAAGKWLNVVEMKNTDIKDSTIKIVSASGDSTLSLPFTKKEDAFYDLYGRDKDLLYIYKTTQKEFSGNIIKRARNYIFPNYWYQFYSDTSIVDNRNFYIKSLLMCLLIIFSMAVFIGLLFSAFIKK